MLMRVTPRVKKQENNLEILGGGGEEAGCCAGAKQVRDGAIAQSGTRPSATTVFSVCFTELMVWINPLIAVSLKTRLPEGYCSACACWARLFVATGVAFALTLGPAIAACSYIYY